MTFHHNTPKRVELALVLCLTWTAASDSFSPHHHSQIPSTLSASTTIPYRVPPDTEWSSETESWPPTYHSPIRVREQEPTRHPTKSLHNTSLLLSDPLPEHQWTATYCSVTGLRETFGTNVHGWWGDLDAATTRRLYHSLLPTALWELYDMGAANATTLAPLAYAARVAAKLYARERSQWMYRWGAELWDGFRHLKRYKTFDTTGMSYEQVFQKYQDALGGASATDVDVCQKILERSCVSNEQINQWCERSTMGNMADLETVSRQLETDLRELLRHDHNDIAKIRALRVVVRLKRRIAAIRKQFQ